MKDLVREAPVMSPSFVNEAGRKTKLRSGDGVVCNKEAKTLAFYRLGRTGRFQRLLYKAHATRTEDKIYLGPHCDPTYAMIVIQALAAVSGLGLLRKTRPSESKLLEFGFAKMKRMTPRPLRRA